MILIALQFVATCITLVLGLLVLSGLIVCLHYAWNLFTSTLKGK
jgi:hypothetical protein